MVSSMNGKLTLPPRPVLVAPDYSKDVAGYDARFLKISGELFSPINNLRRRYAEFVGGNSVAARAIVDVSFSSRSFVLSD